MIRSVTESRGIVRAKIDDHLTEPCRSLFQIVNRRRFRSSRIMYVSPSNQNESSYSRVPSDFVIRISFVIRASSFFTLLAFVKPAAARARARRFQWARYSCFVQPKLRLRHRIAPISPVVV